MKKIMKDVVKPVLLVGAFVGLLFTLSRIDQPMNEITTRAKEAQILALIHENEKDRFSQIDPHSVTCHVVKEDGLLNESLCRATTTDGNPMIFDFNSKTFVLLSPATKTFPAH